MTFATRMISSVLCTDALAECLLRRLEMGDRPKWDDFWKLSDQQWRDAILARRDGREIRIDDTTFMLLQIKVLAKRSRETFVPGQPHLSYPRDTDATFSRRRAKGNARQPAMVPPHLPITELKPPPLPVGPGQRNSDSHPPRSRHNYPPPLPLPVPKEVREPVSVGDRGICLPSCSL